MQLKIMVKAFCFLFIQCVIATKAMSQKTGYIDISIMVGITPEAEKIDSALKKYEDTLNRQFEGLVIDYKYRDSILNSKDTANMPLSVKLQNQNSLRTVVNQINNWSSISQQLIGNRQQQLLHPVYNKLIKVIQQVAKERGYSYVYDKNALIAAPIGDDLLPAVAQKLNIKIPSQVEIGIK